MNLELNISLLLILMCRIKHLCRLVANGLENLLISGISAILQWFNISGFETFNLTQSIPKENHLGEKCILVIIIKKLLIFI